MCGVCGLHVLGIPIWPAAMREPVFSNVDNPTAPFARRHTLATAVAKVQPCGLEFRKHARVHIIL